MNQKLMYVIAFLGFMLQIYQSFSQINKENALIPREVLFDLKDRKELIRLKPDASAIFYVKGAYQPIPDNRIYCRNLHDLQKEIYYEFTEAVGDYKILNESFLLVRTISANAQSIRLLSIEDSSSVSIFKDLYRSIRWLAFSEGNNAAVFVAKPINSNPILFTYDFNTKHLDTISNIAQGHYPLFFDQELNVVAGERIDQESGNKTLAYYKKGNWHEIESFEWSAERFLRPGLKSIVGVCKNGLEIYYTDNTNSDRTVLKSFDISTKESKVLVSEQRSDLMTNSFISDNRGEPIAMANHYSKRNWNVIDPKYNADFKFLSDNFKDFQILDITNDLRYWVIEEMTGGANNAYLYNFKKKTCHQLFTDHDVLEKYRTINRFYAEVTSHDDLKLPIQYYLSQKFDQDKNGLPDNKMPAILFVHGGPWQGWMEDFWLITRHLQLLADRGYLVVYSQFRGALTYGKNFLDAGNEEWGDGMMKDKVAIAHWLTEERNILKDKIGIFGWSYGGYASLAGAAFAPETYACAMSLYGPTHLDAPQKEYGFGYSSNSLLRIADVNTEKGRKLAYDHSPLYAADKINIPILMSTGAKDDRVPQMQMDKMAEALKEAEKDITYFVYPKEGHDFKAKDSWTTFWSIAEPFLRKHLGGLAEPVHDEDYTILEMKYQSNTY